MEKNEYENYVAKIKTMSYEEFVEALKHLRRLREVADARFLCLMVQIEEERSKEVAAWGHETFANFIEYHKFVNVGRYERFKVGLKKVGYEKALELGVEIVVGASKLTTKRQVSEYTHHSVHWINDHSGMRPSSRTVVTEILSKVFPEKQVPASTKRQSEIQRLRKRIQVLEKEVSRLKSENSKLRAQVKKKTKKKDLRRV